MVTLAAKQANPTSSTSPTPTAEAAPTREDLEGGKLSDKPKMDTSPPSSNSHQLAHDDNILKEKILKILNSDDGTCQSKSAQIMDTILQHRRKRVLELDREKVPPATARFLSEGGSKPKTKTDTKPTKRTEQKVKKRQNLRIKFEEKTKEEPETTEEEQEEEEEEGEQENEQEGEEEEGEEEEEEEEQGDLEENGGEGTEEVEEEEDDEERRKDSQEAEDNSAEESEPESISNPRQQKIIKTRFSNALSRILTILAKKGMSLSDRILNLLDTNLDKLSFFISGNPLFKTTSSLVIYGSKKFCRSGHPPYIHMDKLLASLSLPTLSLFRYILGSRVSPKRFTPSEKQIISTIVKLSNEISIASIPSPKIRSICT